MVDWQREGEPLHVADRHTSSAAASGKTPQKMLPRLKMVTRAGEGLLAP